MFFSFITGLVQKIPGEKKFGFMITEPMFIMHLRRNRWFLKTCRISLIAIVHLIVITAKKDGQKKTQKADGVNFVMKKFKQETKQTLISSGLKIKA